MEGSGSMDEIDLGQLGDARLQSIAWCGDDGSDLQLDFQGAGGAPIAFRFEWVTEVLVDLDFGADLAGRPLVWEASMMRDEERRDWRVVIDFAGAPDGSISFRCSAARIESGGK